MINENREVVEKIVNELLHGKICTDTSIFSELYRIATWTNPYVDYAYVDDYSKKTIAIILYDNFNDNEIVKENTVKAISEFDMVINAYDVRSLNEANFYLQDIIRTRLNALPIAVVVYDSNGKVSPLNTISISEHKATKRTVKEQRSYWCWWRDGSHFEVATLLELSRKYNNEQGDIYTNLVYPEFFNLMIEGKTKKWDGTPRIKQYSKSSYKSEKQNYKIPMCQLGLWNVETGHITRKGESVLSIIEQYGADSKEYFDYLAKIILLDGKHLDLIKDLEDFQKNNMEIIPESSSEFFILFDDYMTRKNSIGTRKPTAQKTGAKKAYVRDEPKLWNKLGIVKLQGKSRYYKPYVGIEFDWNRINEILLTDIIGGSNEKI